MGDIVGDVPLLVHERLRIADHPVEGADQVVDFAAFPGGVDAQGIVAGGDYVRGAADPVDAGDEPPGEQPSHQRADQQDRDSGDAENGDEPVQ